ncbi:MAG: lysylphosphatidylglycerol synthase transmembrane domain-containing protein [Alphaproteobacteria bacterium]|nr:lysylphosphatidylglycerol synthase transmembrane domain-containing protein [Alphaproteobacteria bacterium]
MAVSLCLLIFLLRELNPSEVKHALADSQLGYIAVAPALMLLQLGVLGMRWQLLLRWSHYGFTWWFCFRAYLTGLTAGMLLPGILGGDLVRLALTVKSGTSVATVSATILIERLSGLVMVSVIVASSLAIMDSDLIPLNRNINAIVFLPVAAAILVMAVIRGSLGAELQDWLVSRKTRLAAQLSNAVLTSREIPNGILLKVGGLSLIGQLLSTLAIYAIALGIGITLPFSFFLFVSAVVYLATVLPISIGGLGVREGIFAYYLAANGSSYSIAIALGLLVYFNQVVVAVIGAVTMTKSTQMDD